LSAQRKAPNDLGGWVQGFISQMTIKGNGMNATTGLPSNQPALPSRRGFAQALVVLAIPSIGDAEPKFSESDLRREEVAGLCQQVEFMRAWFAQYRDQIKTIGPRAAGELNDVVIDAVCTARSLARVVGTTLDRYDDYPWGIDPRDYRPT
jgi:hypothetical protein